METIDGVTIRHSLFDAGIVSRLASLELLVFAWTVNDLERVDELIRFGVDGIVTDNLAILNLFGAEERGERDLAPSRP